MSAVIRVGISPCPNDTFAFHGLLSGRVPAQGLELDFRFADIEELNRLLAAGELDVAKVSFSAALAMTGECALLRSGSAIAAGAGPLLLAAAGRGRIEPGARVLCPGEHTTAALLYRLFHPGEGRVDHVVFSQILPALERGEADFGVCIHEGRFTWQGRGLRLVEDLGERWEASLGIPRALLPLGGCLARKRLGRAVGERVSGLVRASLDYGWSHREEALATMRAHAQESTEGVLWRHVELYVTDQTRELSESGEAALEHLAGLARQRGLLPAGSPPLEIWGPRSRTGPGDARNAGGRGAPPR